MSHVFTVEITVTGNKELQLAVAQAAKSIGRLEDLEVTTVAESLLLRCYTEGFQPVVGTMPEEDRPCYFPPAGEVYDLSQEFPELAFRVQTFDQLNGTEAEFTMHSGMVGDGKITEYGCSEERAARQGLGLSEDEALVAN